MRRAGFLTIGLAALSVRTARSQEAEEYDPAQTAATPSLRVLLGAGSATPNGSGTFTFEGRVYRGSFASLPDGSVVNTVGLEDYLYSVVPREMSPSWPGNALAAQAICARTYVLQKSNPRRAYDLVPSELDQVYDGVASESGATRSAVDATRGNVLRYGSAFAEVMYSSCCGGHTEAVNEAWGGALVPYLGGVECTHCVASPNYQWTVELALGDVAARFADEVGALGELNGIRVSDIDASGRARMVELDAARGSAFVRGSAFRTRMGTRVVRSLLLKKIDAATEAPTRMIIEGGGLGHGVGLCQWGARGMALAGATSRDILDFYFPGTMIGHD